MTRDNPSIYQEASYEKIRSKMLVELGDNVFAVGLFGTCIRPVEVKIKNSSRENYT